MLMSMECKKHFFKKISASLPRAMTKAFGKEWSFAEGRPIALGKDLLEKFWNISLPRAMVGGPRQRLFLKIIKFLCRGPAWKPLAKIFQKKE